MARLAAMGVSLAVDDFGTGFSSLSVLHRFPIRRLKIDRSFISGIERRDSSQAIVKQHGCDSFQGFLFSRPLSAEAFASLLAAPERNLPLAPAIAEPVALRPDA